MEGQHLLFVRGIDHYEANCTPGGIDRPSCQMSQTEIAKRDVMASVRMVVALLSILGTVSIIISVIRRKQVLNPKIHTIFMLSIADLLLAVMWVVGGGMWMSGGMDQEHYSRVGCFTVLLITVIVECVTINLTCIYALLAYSSIKRKDFSNVYSLFDKDVKSHAWKPWKIVVAYIISWVLPVILIMVPFSVVAYNYHLVREANKCSCRCLPYFGNVAPLASPRDNATAYYKHHMSMLVASYGLVLVGSYLVGFVILIIAYWKILRLIQRMRKSLVTRSGSHKTYGVTSNIIMQGQSQAKQRVVYFLTVFLISGFFNLALSLAHVAYQSKQLRQHPVGHSKEHKMPLYVFVMYIGQSITIPLQGFLNALVYGWTRDDFVHAVRAEDTVINSDNKLYKERSSSIYQSPPHVLTDSTSHSKSWVGHDTLSSIPEH